MTVTANVTLYDLGNARDILDQWLAETDGELTPELEQLLAELDGQTDDKIERVGLFIQEQLRTAEMVNAEVERLRARADAHLKAAKSLKEYLRLQMLRLEKTKVVGTKLTVSLQKNPPACTVPVELAEERLRDLASILPEFVTHVPESFALNKRAVLDAAKKGPLPNEIAIHVEITQSVSVRLK